ncbi:MAG TPA: SDR family NAD(P)-dependent oxidoreductase, partial [Oceanithermus profundus]|nr:SDR family NAD(P)-dependent oxidoreductase [Oceanithermus profundus]
METMDLGLKGKTAIVTGASQGIGRAIADALAAEGARVVLSARNEEKLARAAAEICAAAGDAAYYAGDLNDPETAEQLVAFTEREFGRVDLLVGNTGGPPSGEAHALDEGVWRAAAEQLFYPLIRLTRQVLPGMRERGWGRILYITSISVKEPIESLALSNALRAAVTGFAKTLSREVAADGVTVNTLGPGYTATERVKHLFEDN